MIPVTSTSVATNGAEEVAGSNFNRFKKIGNMGPDSELFRKSRQFFYFKFLIIALSSLSEILSCSDLSKMVSRKTEMSSTTT
jgi:hypothetical protein